VNWPPIALCSWQLAKSGGNYRNKEVELSPRATMSYFSRALLHYRLGNHAPAIPDFTRSAELDHEQAIGPANYLYRGDCHRRLGDYEKAIADCALVPGDFDFPGFLGQWEGSKHHLLAEIDRERGG
jgi:tetratricopeptide (TPR) repeat protein